MKIGMQHFGPFGGTSYTSPQWTSFPLRRSGTRIARPSGTNAFTLVEVLVVMTLLSLIVLSLMMVLNSTQTAFRAGISQTGVLESGRAVTDLIKSDLEGMTPSFGISNSAVGRQIFTPQ